MTALHVSSHHQPMAPKVPKRRNDRIILHFDYDCFYASVFENENPAWKALPLGVKQKSILATCNYVARARGVKKLMLISEAQKICPDLVLMNGEDLTRFRDVSKKLWSFLRSHSWNDRVERLGLDEVFLDVTDIIEYNQQILNRNALADSFFQLSRRDPEKGFGFDASTFFGCNYPSDYAASSSDESLDDPLYVRLVLASHLAGYLRLKLEEDFGHTSACGVSTNKLLAKLAGNLNKPKNQTTLLSLRDEDVQEFMDDHQIRKIPGMGFKISHQVENHVQSKTTAPIPHDHDHSPKITTREVLAHPDISPETLERILGGSGSERGIGDKVWNLLHGIDNTDVKKASDVPTQISIEDTYMSRPLNTPADLMRELRALTTSLIRRMRVDLLDGTTTTETSNGIKTSSAPPTQQRWLAHPKTLRLSTRVKSSSARAGSGPSEEKQDSFSRSSRSQSLPSFVFSLKEDVERIAERLVHEAVLPLFRRLHHSERRGGWNLALVNICVTNMVMIADERNNNNNTGRDISVMFKTQDAKLREWTAYDDNDDDDDDNDNAADDDTPVAVIVAGAGAGADESASSQESEGGDAMVWESAEGSQRCSVCGQSIPMFAVSAHNRFHALDGTPWS